MPQPGDRHPGFISEPMRCWALVYDGTMQADSLRVVAPTAAA
jgi:hypothetical protein